MEKEYGNGLSERQKKHLEDIEKNRQPCLHDGCPECHGTGRKADGSSCIHMLSCPCPRCNAIFM